MNAPERVVIGMEVHLQLATKTKLFCGCENRFDAPPNSLVCPVCLGHPGALPVLNREALRRARLLATALNATLSERVSFDRKHYFYPDLPKGYQITQRADPVGRRGAVPVDDGVVSLERIHLEEDAGRTNGSSAGSTTAIDMNRAGVPLVELVSRPVIRSAAEAVAYVKSIREIARFTGVSDAEMSRGNLRCEPNVNLEFGDAATPITEIKNLNSLRSLRRGIEQEIERQRAEFAATGVTGGHGRKVTRGYDDERDITVPLRRKEEAQDYRFLPDPDLPPQVVEPTAAGTVPELPRRIRERWMADGGISAEAAGDLSATPELAAYFEAVIAGAGRDAAGTAAGFILTDVLRGDGPFPVTAERLAGLVALVASGRITRQTARGEVWPALLASNRTAEEIVAAAGLDGSPGDLDSLVGDALRAAPDAVAAYRAGRDAAIGPLIGYVIRAARGRVDPEGVRARIEAAIDRDRQTR